jgi:hypothetical protein
MSEELELAREWCRGGYFVRRLCYARAGVRFVALIDISAERSSDLGAVQPLLTFGTKVNPVLLNFCMIV